MVEIDSSKDSVQIEFLGKFSSYDGHCLRAFSYFADEMPDIKAQIEEIKKEGKTFKVTHDDGSVEYLNENNPKLQEYMNQVA